MAAQQNYMPIVTRGSLLYDPYFASARMTIQQLLNEIQKASSSVPSASQNEQVPWTPDNVTSLVTLISKWQQAQTPQGLPQILGLSETSAVSSPTSTLLNTFFYFEPESFQMFVDVRGFEPPEIRVSVSSNVVEVRVSHENCDLNAVCASYACRNISKVYHLPKQLVSEKAQCCLSADGTLVVYAPWLQYGVIQ